jgi:hypothetical protein
MRLEDILPKTKDDIDSIMKLKTYSFAQIQPVATDLLACLQDMNWPIAQYVADYLQPHTNELTDEIFEIFRSNDEMWKYWIIIIFFVNANGKVNEILIHELIRMRDSPSSGEIDNEVNEVAKEALEHLRQYS